MPLTQADLIAVTIGTAQIIATVAVGIWTVSKATMPSSTKNLGAATISIRKAISSFVRKTWFFWVFAAYGTYEITQASQFTGQLSAGYVLKVVLLAIYVLFNVVAALIFWGLEMVMEVLGGVLDVQRRSVEIHADTLSLTKNALTKTSTQTRHKRRTG